MKYCLLYKGNTVHSQSSEHLRCKNMCTSIRRLWRKRVSVVLTSWLYYKFIKMQD